MVYKALKFSSENKFVAAHVLRADNDDDAIMLAELVAGEHKVDLWEGSRFVDCIERSQ